MLTETLRALGKNVKKLNINRFSIRRELMKHHAQLQKIERSVQNKCSLACLLGWKIMQDLTRKTHVDRLPIIVAGLGINQLLKIAKISNGNGQSQADAVVLALEEWGLA